MTQTPPGPAGRWLPRVLACVGAAGLLLATAVASPASAHGSTTDPPSRVYGCYERWGDDTLNPAMVTEDPMCWEAWQTNQTAMWNWNALNRHNVAGNYQAVIPDGQLCSGGLTKEGRYATFDKPGNWRAVDKPRQFTLNFLDEAGHGGQYVRVYITRQGFDPLTQPLRWSDLELVTTTGAFPRSDGSQTYAVPVNAGNRTGRHIVYTIWLAAHQDESYYYCSDVNFTGGPGGTPTAAPTTPAPTTPAPTTPAPTTPPTTPPASPTTPPTGMAGCTASYAIVSQWTGGFQAEVRIRAGSAAIAGWAVNWSFANGQTVANAWNATVTTSGSTVTARNMGYNGTVAANGSATFGFIGTSGSTNQMPSLTCTAT
jgi:predicted carbohydrate-binding protein with CBM5 and CBM33 domain